MNGNSYRATEVGIMTSNLYINPRTAYALTELLERENLTEENLVRSRMMTVLAGRLIPAASVGVAVRTFSFFSLKFSSMNSLRE